MTTIKVEVISDIVCLWCFIGKRTLEKAIALFRKTYPGGRHDTFEIIWRPYYLDYSRFVSSTQSVDKTEVANVKFGGVSEEKMAAMRNRVEQIARANGIEFRFGGKIGSTRDAHRLIDFAQRNASPEIQDAIVEKLFSAYHEMEMDISDPVVLRGLAVDAGLKEDQAEQLFMHKSEAEEIDEEAHENRKLAPTGVPTFIIQNEYQVDGAQDLQEFFEAFVKVREGEQAAA